MTSVRIKANIVLAFFAGAAALLFQFPPEQYGFYPRCPIFRFTHWECPGCGSTRALAALLHGRIAEALHYNALFIFLAPLFLSYFVVTYCVAMRDNRLVWPSLPMPVLKSLLFFTIVFTVSRNLHSL
jgi:hypothetical protein